MNLASRVSVVIAAAACALPAHAQTVDADATFRGLSFRAIGPATPGGRIDDFAVLETNPSVFYVATAAGGLWKTVNGGTTWQTVFNHEDVVSIGDVAIPANDANLVWVGSGENNNRQSSSWGGGIFKSTDGGQTWTNMGLAETRHIARIVIDPTDHDIVYVAALGHLWGPNKERGIYKTTDGGRTWTNILYVDDNTGGTELVMDPSNNQVLYAATYQRQRSNWGMNGGGPGSAIWKTTDAGAHWTKLTNGIPSGPLGRIGLDIYRKNPNVLYARIEHPTESGTYRTDDAGGHWTKVSDLNPRPMYFSQIRIDPNNDQRVYVLGVDLYWTDDGGKTWVSTTVPHSDHHALWIDPNNSNHVLTGCDGGVNQTWDKGKTWDFIDNLNIGQFYHVGYDFDSPYHVYGGLQDNSSWGGPSAVRHPQGIGNFDWFIVGTGDGFVALVDPKDPRTIYAESQGGNMNRVDRESREWKNIKPVEARGEPSLRWNWDTPIAISPFASSTIYAAANKVFKSTDRGQSWKAISPDLTYQIDRDKLSIMGVVGKDVTIAKNDGVSSYGVIVTFAESPNKAGVLWSGADDGALQVTQDGGAHWTNVTGNVPGLPKNTAVSRVAPSKYDAGTVYVTFNNHRSDDYAPYVYVSHDFGKSFTPIVEGIPAGQAMNTITEDPRNGNVLYGGSEFGLFVSLDKGAHWSRWHANLPTVPIDEITIQPRDDDMLLATHGRGIWILDDLTPVQRASAVMSSNASLFDVRSVTEYLPYLFRNDFGGPGDRRFWGQNPTFGAGVSYYLKDAASSATVTIADSTGKVVRTLPLGGDNLGAGVHRVYWDLRHQPLPAPKYAAQGGGGQQNGVTNLDGPFVLPGAYHVTLAVGGQTVGTKTVRVLPDPAMPMTVADRKTMHSTLVDLQALQGASDAAATAVGELSDQIAAVQKAVRDGNAPQSASSAVDDVNKSLVALRRELSVPAPGQTLTGRGGGGGFGGNQPLRSRIVTVKREIMASTSLPTTSQAQGAREARADLSRVIGQVNDIIQQKMPAVSKALAGSSAAGAVKPLQPVAMP